MAVCSFVDGVVKLAGVFPSRTNGGGGTAVDGGGVGGVMRLSYANGGGGDRAHTRVLFVELLTYRGLVLSPWLDFAIVLVRKVAPYVTLHVEGVSDSMSPPQRLSRHCGPVLSIAI